VDLARWADGDYRVAGDSDSMPSVDAEADRD
jgi:endogenous inhibitor of DNA gyrase (YacG/DUF329 family)